MKAVPDVGLGGGALRPSGRRTAHSLRPAARLLLLKALRLGLCPLPGQILLQFGFKKQPVTWQRRWGESGGQGAQTLPSCPQAGGGAGGAGALTWAVCRLLESSLLAAAPAQVEHTPVALRTGGPVSLCGQPGARVASRLDSQGAQPHPQQRGEGGLPWARPGEPPCPLPPGAVRRGCLTFGFPH